MTQNAPETAIRPVDNAPQLAVPCKPLKPKQLKALELRMRGMSQAEVAAILKKNPATICRWEQKPEWISKRAEFVAKASERSLAVVQEHLEAVAQAACDTAIEDRNTNAQRTVLEMGGVLKTNDTAAQKAQPLAVLLQHCVLNMRVEPAASLPVVNVSEAHNVTDAEFTASNDQE